MATILSKIILLATLLLFSTVHANEKHDVVTNIPAADESKIPDVGVSEDGTLVITIYVPVLRDPSSRAEQTITADVIDVKKIQKTNTVDTVEAIKRVSGLNVVQSGPTGQQTSVFMRGTNSNHVLVMINGVPIKDHSTTGGLHDISNDFLNHATSVEVIKGSHGTLYGPNAVGGVINFKTDSIPENSIIVSAGSFDTKKVTLNVGKYFVDQNTFVSLTVDGAESNGISASANGTEDDGFEAKNFTINSRTGFGQNGLNEFGIMYSTKENDSELDSGSGDDLDYTANNKFSIFQSDVKIKNDLGHSKFVISNNKYDRTYTNGTEIDTYDSESTTFIGTNTFMFDNFDITPGVEHEDFSGKFDNNGSYQSEVDKSSFTTGYFVNGNLQVTDSLIISGGVRHDDPKDFSTYNTYRIGSAYTIAEGLQFKINKSTAVKTPTLYELYGSDNFGYSGNPNLKPEEATTTDIGLSYNDSLTNLDIVYFTTDLDNALKYQSSTYVNDTAKSNRHGVELNMARQLTNNLKTYSATTFTIAEDSNGTELTRRPKWTNSTGLEHTHGQYTNIIELDYVGSHKDIDSSTYATIKKPSVSLTNFHSTYKIDDNKTISLSVKNIFDESYESPDGYSQPGRNWMLTFKKKF